jgi:hypothetical protein
MAKQPTKDELKSMLANQNAELLALRIFASAAFRRIAYDLEVPYDMPHGTWTARILNPTAAHGGVCVVVNEEGTCLYSPITVDELVSSLLHSRDSYMAEFGRVVLRARNACFEASKIGPK